LIVSPTRSRLRGELTINNPNDFDFTKGLDQLPA